MAFWRQQELDHFGDKLRWLEPDVARRSYEYVMQFSSSVRYGLEESAVMGIEGHVIGSLAVAQAWVRDRVPVDDFTVRVVFGRGDVVLLPTTLFMAVWPDLWVPGRDDVIVAADRAEWILFFSHGQEIELGWRTPRRRTSC